MYKSYADSTLKSFTKDQLIGIIRCLEHNVSVAEERNDNQFALLIRLFGISKKHRWHDLKKNPKDLPKVCEYDKPFSVQVEFVIESPCFPYFVGDTGYCDLSDPEPNESWSGDSEWRGDVIAWRYKDTAPFEED